MRFVSILILIALARSASAQQNEEPVAELKPIIVSGTFRLQLAHPEADHAVLAIEREILEREAREKARAQSVLFDAKFWRYIPFKFGLSAEQEFFTPSYSTVAYRDAEKQLRSSEREPLIAR